MLDDGASSLADGCSVMALCNGVTDEILMSPSQGLGTDEETLIELVCSRSTTELVEIKRVYKERKAWELCHALQSSLVHEYQCTTHNHNITPIIALTHTARSSLAHDYQCTAHTHTQYHTYHCTLSYCTVLTSAVHDYQYNTQPQCHTYYYIHSYCTVLTSI